MSLIPEQTESEPRTIERRRIVLDFLPELARWVDPATGATNDPVETEYAEGFGPAPAAVLFAKGYEWTRDPRWPRLASLTIHRSLNLTESRIRFHTDFTRLFLAYYAFQALHLLGNGLEEGERRALLTRFAACRPAYTHNLNGALMTWMQRVNLDTLDCAPCDWDGMSTDLRGLAGQQTPAGFLNDDVGGDGHPIAYHLLCYAIIAQALALRSRRSAKWNDERFVPARDWLIEMLRRENGWTARFTAADHSFSMTERSRDHFWTAGAYVAYWRARGLPDEHPMIQGHLRFWGRCAKPDGTYSITRNRFPHPYRVGFESYACAALYTTLGMALLASAEGEFLPENALHPSDSAEHDQPAGWFSDPASGYAHWRGERSSAGLVLSRRSGSRSGGYALAGSLFNLCLDARPARVIAAPAAFPAEYRLSRKRTVVNHEGIMAVGRDDEPIWPNPVRRADARERDGVVIVSWEQDEFLAVRRLAIGRGEVLSRWDITPKRPLKAIELTLPIVIDDGGGVRELKIDGDVARLTLPEGDRYVLHAQGEWRLDLGISSESTDGLTRSLRMGYAPAKMSGSQPVSLGWSLRRIESDAILHTDGASPLAPPSLDDESAWIWKYGDPRRIRREGQWIHYDLSADDKIYLVAGGPLRNWETPPSEPMATALTGAALYAIDLYADYYPRDNRSNVEVVWLNYAADRLVRQVAFPLYSGRNRFPVSTGEDAGGFRLALRFNGQGRLRVRDLRLRPFPSP